MTKIERQSLAHYAGRYRSSVAIVVVASIFMNVMVFAGTLYMMLVYDSVLPSGSLATLAGLFAMLLVLYAFQTVFESIRGDALLTIANGVHDELFRSVHYATTSTPLKGPVKSSDGLQLVRDLDQIHSFLAGPGPVALIDLPWVIVFLIILSALHWALGLTALVGTLVLVLLAVHTSKQTAKGLHAMGNVVGARSAATLDELRFVESATAMGMRDRLLARAGNFEHHFIEAQSFLSRVGTRLGSSGKVLRMLLQSGMLTVGALLVIDGKASGGVILASSVLSGRALAPVDMAIGNWRNMSAARTGWTRLMEAIDLFRPPQPRSVQLDPPSKELRVRDLWLVPPGTERAVLNGISLDLIPGQAVAIIGPSAAGKTTLARALVGIWPPSRGEIRIDGATYDQWDPDQLGASFGYVPQSVDILEGTIGQNIARFDPQATSEAVVAAAKAAGMHQTILAMPQGYDSRVTSSGMELSAGQRQRIGLARALYGNPFLIVLDEANSNLDGEGDAALATAVEAIKARGGIVVMITHRPATLGPMTHIAVLNQGKIVEFGTRDDVMKKLGAAPALANPPGPPQNKAESA